MPIEQPSFLQWDKIQGFANCQTILPGHILKFQETDISKCDQESPPLARQDPPPLKPLQDHV